MFRKLAGAIIVAVIIIWVATAIAGHFGASSQSSQPAAISPVTTPAPTPSDAAVSPAQAPAAGDFSIRSNSTPDIEVDDMHLSTGECHAIYPNAAAGDVLPDRSCTPGSIDPAVTQANIHSTICASGYTSKVRPSSSVTSRYKVKSLAQYGLAYAHSTEYDHLISLELGGSSSTSNLWPEQNHTGASNTTNPKDAVENKLAAAVCSGKTTLSAAQVAIATNWTTALSTLGIS